MDPKKNEMEILYGGTDLTVRLLSGGQETVKVRKVSFRDLSRMGQAIVNQNDAAEVLLYTGKDEAWLESIEPEDAIEIISVGRRLSEGPFQKWFASRKEALLMLEGKPSVNQAEPSDSPSSSNS